MKTIAALIAGLVLGTTGIALGAPQPGDWFHNGVTCTMTGAGSSRGVVCGLDKGRKIVIVNQHSIIVAARRGNSIYYTTAP